MSLVSGHIGLGRAVSNSTLAPKAEWYVEFVGQTTNSEVPVHYPSEPDWSWTMTYI